MIKYDNTCKEIYDTKKIEKISCDKTCKLTQK